MILGRILEFLAAQRLASLSEIARAVDSSPEAVRSMLDTLQRRGLVHRFQPPGACGSSCRECAPGEIEVYGAGPGRSADVSACDWRG